MQMLRNSDFCRVNQRALVGIGQKLGKLRLGLLARALDSDVVNLPLAGGISVKVEFESPRACAASGDVASHFFAPLLQMYIDSGMTALRKRVVRDMMS